MNQEYRICRICLTHENEETFNNIYDAKSHIPKDIFLVSGIKILEFINYKVPALICTSCMQDLSVAAKFKRRCIKSEQYFKKCLSEIESFFWSERSHIDNEDRIKEEQDENNIYFFSNVDAIIEEEININKDIISVNDSIEIESNGNTGGKIRRTKRNVKEEEIYQVETTAHCNLCFRTFSSMHSFKDHMRAIHQKLDESDMFKCPYCNRLFKMKYYLNRHIRNSHKRTPAKQKRLKEPKPRNEDEIFKEKLTGSKCPYCSKYLTSRHSLNDHIRVKHEFINFSDRFLCDMCGKDFPLKYYLLRHIKASHLKTLSYKRKNSESLPCSICGKILKSKGNLSTHERTHRVLTADEYWYCDLCGNKFKGRGEMTVHIKKRHLYKINYPCKICPGKSWQTLFQLQRHIKVFHQNIREFKCEWCGKEFGEKNKLICHTRIHTGEQPFQCTWENCDRKFTHQTDLRRHYWGHTGQRPYRCEVPNCLKGFMKKSELLAHENRGHSVNQPQVRTSSLPIPYEYQIM